MLAWIPFFRPERSGARESLTRCATPTVSPPAPIGTTDGLEMQPRQRPLSAEQAFDMLKILQGTGDTHFERFRALSTTTDCKVRSASLIELGDLCRERAHLYEGDERCKELTLALDYFKRGFACCDNLEAHHRSAAAGLELLKEYERTGNFSRAYVYVDGVLDDLIQLLSRREFRSAELLLLSEVLHFADANRSRAKLDELFAAINLGKALSSP